MASLPLWVAPRQQAVFVQGLSDQLFVSIEVACEVANNLSAVWRVGKALDQWTDRMERPSRGLHLVEVVSVESSVYEVVEEGCRIDEGGLKDICSAVGNEAGGICSGGEGELNEGGSFRVWAWGGRRPARLLVGLLDLRRRRG